MSLWEVYVYLVSFLLLLLSNYFFLLYLNLEEKNNKYSLEDIKKKFGKLPKILFIVPAFNEEKTIEKTIRSIASINYPKENYYILVVDDGSKDRTFEVANKLKKDIENLIVLKKENGGKASAINYGLKFALKNMNFDFFAIIDADTYIDKNYPLLLLGFDSKTLAVVPRILPNNEDTFVSKLQKIEYSLSNFLKLIYSNYFSWYIVNTGALIKKETIDKIGFFNENSINEDLDYGLRILRKGFKISYFPEIEIKTEVPNTLIKLIKQRIRWFYGWFIHTFENIKVFTKDLMLISLLTFYYNLIAFIIIVLLFLIKDFPKLIENLKYFDVGYYLWQYKDFNILEYIRILLSNSISWLFVFTLLFAFVYHTLVKHHNKIRINVLWSYLYLSYYWIILAISQMLALINIIRKRKKWWR